MPPGFGMPPPGLLLQPPPAQALPGFGYTPMQPPGQPGPLLFGPPGHTLPFGQPTPPPGPPPGLGVLATPIASTAQTGARNVRARTDSGAPNSALSRFRGFDEALSPDGDSSALSGMETEQEAAGRQVVQPGKDQASALTLTNLERVTPVGVSGAELGRLAVEAAPRTGGFSAAELIATHLQGAGLEVNSNFGIEAGSEEELIWVDGIVGLALFETPSPRGERVAMR